MASHSYVAVKRILEAIGLLDAMPDFQREELDDSILDVDADITVGDLALAGLNEQQASAFISECRAHMKREGCTAARSESSSSSEGHECSSSEPNSSLLDASHLWRWQSDDGSSYNDFDAGIMLLLERALVAGQKELLISEKNWSFDLDSMIQTNTFTLSARKIQRVQIGTPAASSPSFQLPYTRVVLDSSQSSSRFMDMQIDPDALIAPNLLQQMESSPSDAPKRLPPPLPPARRSSSDAPSGQMSISTKLLVVYVAENVVFFGNDATAKAQKMRSTLLVQGSNLHLDAILCFCQRSADTPEHCLRKDQCVNLACSTISKLKQSDRTNGSKMYPHCLGIDRCDTGASVQQFPDEYVDTFSRQNIFVCFQDVTAFETFMDAVKRACSSAEQVLKYIDSLPLPTKKDKGASGSKGFSLFRGITDIGTNMLATGGAAVTKIIGTAPAAAASRDDLNLSGEAFRVIVDVLKLSLRDREASYVHVSQICNKEDVFRSLTPVYMNQIDELCELHELEQDGYFFFKNPSRLSWLQILPLTLLSPLEPVQCSKLRALKLPKSLIRDSLAKIACGYFDGVFVDSRPLAASNAELVKLDLCSGGLASHQLQPLKSSWHQGLITAISLQCVPLAFADLCSLATGGELPEDCQPGWLNWNVRYGQCVGTCYREFTSLPQSRQLFNAYLSILPDHNGLPRVVMRHAVPNSPDRIKMIGAALKSCKFPVRRLRMLSLLTRHGFNEEESMFVEQQRCFESELVAHPDWSQTECVSISMQANANTKFNWANQGETHNAVCNALAWLRYSSWIIRDLRAWTECSGDLDALLDTEGSRGVLLLMIKKLDDESRLAISSCESPAQVVVRGSISTYFTRLGWFNPDRHGPFQSIRSMNQHISKLLGMLKPIAIALYRAISTASEASIESLKERATKFESLCHAMNIFNRLVSSQYPSGKDNEVLPRTSELALLAALDRMLGVSSLMNCKSGCDRAGLAHGISMAVESLYMSHSSSSVTCALLELDSLFSIVDDRMVRSGDYYALLQEFMLQAIVFELGNRRKADSKKLQYRAASDPQGVAMNPETNDLFSSASPEVAASIALGSNLRNRAEMICLSCELRNMFLKHVMCIGWKVNIHSCGVPGLKYNINVAVAKSGISISGKIKSVGKDISTNPHFGVFLPPVALVGDPMQTPVLVRLQINQVVTEEFGAFVNGCSSFRGS